MQATIKNFLKMESAGGIVLMGAAVLAMIVANTPLKEYYDLLLEVPVEVRVGALQIAKPLILWVNDGLMAVFFFLVGLELKREIVEGELSKPANVLLPALGAVGGIVVPVAIYVWFNKGDPAGMQGWAIPAATDIAFALGILMLLGSRVPLSLKVFLVSLAIFDDLGAIAIIALFFTYELSMLALLVAGACLAVLTLMSWRKVSAVSSYVLVGVVMWIAFVNAGISFAGVGMEDLLHPVPMGIAAGLFIGKQLGVFAFCAVAIKLGIARLPEGAGWGALYGVSILSGVGFTMSLFIGGLAFEYKQLNLDVIFDERLGIVLGSLLSGVIGYLVLQKVLPREKA
jgi:NhaA family Na+:H+ antiporter